MKKITTKQDLIKIINNDKLFSKYQLSFYYNFEKTVDVKLLDDYDVMEIIIKNIPHSYKYIKYTHLKDNRDLLLLAIKKEVGNNSVLEFADKKFRKDREIIEQIIIHQNQFEMEDAKYISDEFLHDIDFVSKACKINPLLYRYLSDDVKENEKVINNFLSSPRIQEISYSYLPKKYLQNREFILNFITDGKTSNIYRHISSELKSDYEIAYQAAKCSKNLRNIENDEVKDNFELVSEVLKGHPNNYIYISHRLKNDERVFQLLLKENIYEWNIYQALPEKFKSRKEILLRFGTEWFDLELFKRDVPLSLQQDPDVIDKFGLSSKIVSITYYWYHGFYTKKTADEIRAAIKSHDYESFMKIYIKNRRGLPSTATGLNEKGCTVQVDITKKENFVKITESESEAG